MTVISTHNGAGQVNVREQRVGEELSQVNCETFGSVPYPINWVVVSTQSGKLKLDSRLSF